MQAFTEDAAALLRRLNSDANVGLTTAQAEQNARDFGINTLTKPKPVSFITRLLRSLKEPMVLMLIIAWLVAVAVNIARAATGGETDFLECIGIFLAILLSTVITLVMEGKSAKAFEALNKINNNITVSALRDGKPTMLCQKNIAVGDILLLCAGDKIPADGRLLTGSDLAVDESALTGESIPSKKHAAHIISDEKTPVAERKNMLYSGTYISGGFCKLAVTAVGDDTEFGKIARELSGENKASTPLQERLARLGKLVTVIGVLAAATVFIVQLISFWLNGSMSLDTVTEAFVTSIVLIVATVPEGLPTIVAVSLSVNIIKLSRQNALVKKLVASETVGCINVICSDKTGTLTENKMTVAHEILDGFILKNICLNSTADIGDGGVFIGNPTECALLTAAKKSGYSYGELRKNAEIARVFPFSSEKKSMTTVIKEGDGYIAYSKGSPEKIFLSCAVSDIERQKIEEQIAAYQKKACRVIAFCHRAFDTCPSFIETEIEQNMTFDGFAAISDPLRADVYESVKSCRLAGIDLKILTGDNIVTAKAIADELHILTDGRSAFEAREIEAMSDTELTAILPKIGVIARSTPSIKMRVVNLLKLSGNVVAVTGDGINDAPALKNADVGIAMGISGTEVSKEAADMVLLDDSFSTIVNAVRWGRGIYENFKRFISFQLTVNVSSVITVLASILMGFRAPFTALQLLWINIIMDGPPALALGLEPIHGDLMTEQPVARNQNILSKPLLARVAAAGAYISIIFLLQRTINFLGATAEQMPSVLFALFAMLHLFNSFNCRELGGVTIFKHIFKNRLMLITVSITFILQILLIQFAGAFFDTTGLPLVMWLKILATAVSVIVIFEIAKLAVRRRTF